MNDNILYHALTNRPRKYGETQLTPPLFPRKQGVSPDRPAAVTGREAAKRTLDGEDRSAIIRAREREFKKTKRGDPET